jgi:hypothetical protein
MFMVGAVSQNDIRERENMNPVPGGDTYYIPLNMIRSEDAAAGMAAAEKPEKLPAEEPQRPPDSEPAEEDEDEEDSASALMPVFIDAAERVLRRQAKQIEDLRRKANGTFPEDLATKLRGDVGTWQGIFSPGYLSVLYLSCGTPDPRREPDLSRLDAAMVAWIEADIRLLAANQNYDLKAYIPERADELARKVMEAAKHG